MPRKSVEFVEFHNRQRVLRVVGWGGRRIEQRGGVGGDPLATV
ncbi:MAG TPA: hypothetical protein VFN11_08655 [Ktedonobacterales bacterium]|nr:hypothetical protein [Ktedonobacterales bacterium]